MQVVCYGMLIYLTLRLILVKLEVGFSLLFVFTVPALSRRCYRGGGGEYFDAVAAQVFIDLCGGVKPFVTGDAVRRNLRTATIKFFSFR
jgi:hypothetical protein